MVTAMSASTHAQRLDEAIDALRLINTQTIDTFIDLARDSGPLPVSLRALRTWRTELLALDQPARQRAAALPHLLVDLHFRDAAWWRDARSLASRRMTRHEAPQIAPPKSIVSLARAALMLAWHAVRSESRHATILLGIANPVAHELATLSPAEVIRIAERYAYALTPRWADRAFMWQQFLEAAGTEDRGAMGQVQMRALQLLGGDLLPHSS